MLSQIRRQSSAIRHFPLKEIRAFERQAAEMNIYAGEVEINTTVQQKLSH